MRGRIGGLSFPRYLYHKLGNFFGFEQKEEDDKEDLKGEKTCYLRMHVECVGRAHAGRVHFIRRATMKDADNILFSAWEKVNFDIARSMLEPLKESGQEASALLHDIVVQANNDGNNESDANSQAPHNESEKVRIVRIEGCNSLSPKREIC